MGLRACACCVCWMAGRELDAGLELRPSCGELCCADERARHGLCELDSCGAAHGAERVQLGRASGAHGVWVAGRARVDWHGGRQRLRGVCVGVGQRRGLQERWWRGALLGRWAAACCVCWMAGRELDAGLELRPSCGQLCCADERARHGLCELDCCGAAHGAERVQRWRASGAHGVWVAGRARVDWHGGRQRLRGVCVGV